jgi:hypothetical protein
MQEEIPMTHLVSQRNVAGSPSSRNGISTTSSDLTEEKVDKGLAWLRRLPQLPPEALPKKEDVLRIQTTLMTPCSGVWISARVAALLSPYYEKDIPQSVREMEAEDWREALREFPQWAIERAVRWWKGEENPDRRKRPMEGDIAARCRLEMNGVSSAVLMLELCSSGRNPVQKEEPRERISKEAANEIMAQAGFAAKKL